MREILFRGKRVDNGEWVQGFYVVLGGENHCIFTGRLDITRGIIGFEHFKVDPKTVGQFTGLTDKNGVKIFEGDILSNPINECEKDCRYAVVFSNSAFRPSSDLAHCLDLDWVSADEIIGNIHDNPELLEESNE